MIVAMFLSEDTRVADRLDKVYKEAFKDSGHVLLDMGDFSKSEGAQLLSRCDMAVFSTGWEHDDYTKEAYSMAVKKGLFIEVLPEDPADVSAPSLHPTEVKSPVQAQAFIETVMKMYRVHLDKNNDYSPANILGTGEVGCAVRLWDKIARLLNLTGFELTVTEAKFNQPKEAKNESIDDTYLDAANYAIIGQLLREGRWGK
jgi:hypothetical protein